MRRLTLSKGDYLWEAGDVARRASKLDPESRYKLLADWALPAPDHPVVRLVGEFGPAETVPKTTGEAKPTRVETGGAKPAFGGGGQKSEDPEEP